MSLANELIGYRYGKSERPHTKMPQRCSRLLPMSMIQCSNSFYKILDYGRELWQIQMLQHSKKELLHSVLSSNMVAEKDAQGMAGCQGSGLLLTAKFRTRS